MARQRTATAVKTSPLTGVADNPVRIPRQAIDDFVAEAIGMSAGAHMQAAKPEKGQIPQPFMLVPQKPAPTMPADGSAAINAPGSSGLDGGHLVDATAAATRNTVMAGRIASAAGIVGEVDSVVTRAMPFLAKAAPVLSAVAEIATPLALPLTVAAATIGAAGSAYTAAKAGGDTKEILKAAGWGALDSLTVGQIEKGSVTRRAIDWATDKVGLNKEFHAVTASIDGLRGGGKVADNADARSREFEAANHTFEAHMQEHGAPAKQPDVPGRPPGWSNAARIAAADKQGHQLPYGGDPNQGPEMWRPKEA